MKSARFGLILVGLVFAVNFAAAQQYWNTNGTAASITAANWSSNPAGPFTSAYSATTDMVFGANSKVNYVTTTNIANLTVNDGFTLSWNQTGTLTTGGAVRTFNIGTGSVLDLGAQNFSTAAGTGFVKSGAGVLFTSNGNGFTGGFTLSAGTVIIGGVNALGVNGTLTINGGTLAANATRSLVDKFNGGITVGGNFTLGGTTTGVASGNAVAASNLTFSNNTSLGSVGRTITLGGTGTYTFSGIVSGTASSPGLTLGATAAGTLALTGPNTFTGGVAINGGTLAIIADTGVGTVPVSASPGNITLNGGTLSVGTNATTINANRGINVTANSTINTASAVTYNGLLTGNSQLTKTGASTLTLGGANPGFSGTINHSAGGNAGFIQANTATSLGTGNFTWTGYNRLILNVPDGTTWTVANNFVLPAAGAGGENELIRVGDASPTAGTTARLTGVLSGGGGGGISATTYTLLDSDASGNHNNVLILDNNLNSFSARIEIWRGTLAFTSDGALGNANNAIFVNAGGNNGGLRF